MIEEQEIKLTEGLFTFFNDKPVIIDVGSNKGDWANIILKEYGENCELHLFEPNEKLLSYSEIRFCFYKNITYNNVGVDKKHGVKPFYYFEQWNNEISSLVKDEAWVELPMKQRIIEVVAIDDYIDTNIDCLKIDCEGVDADVVLGAKKKIESGSIKFIIIEYSSHYERCGNTFQSVIDLVKANGYKIYTYEVDNYVELIDFVEDYRFENFVITKEEIKNYSVGGWNNNFIQNTKELPKVELAMEIGCFEGLTTKYICENMLIEGGRVNVVDPLMDIYVDGDTSHPYFKGQYQRFLRNTKGLRIDLFRGKSEDELPKLHALRHDFIYIDGNHYAPHPYIDGCWAFAITKIGGHILFDDYDTWQDTTKDSIDKFLEEFSGSLEVVIKNYQVMIKKTRNQYNSLTYEYYK